VLSDWRPILSQACTSATGSQGIAPAEPQGAPILLFAHYQYPSKLVRRELPDSESESRPGAEKNFESLRFQGRRVT
jgi:hypothetical protein